MKAAVTGLGVSIPPKVLTNDDLAKIMDTSDEWISQRTGIRERRVVNDAALMPSDLGAEAARMALARAGVDPGEVDGIICGCINPDQHFPATACFIQQKIGAAKAFAFDVTAACAGFVVGVNLASQFIASGQCRQVLVVGAEVMSRVVDWGDRNTSVLFGDGAGAALLSASDHPDRGVLGSCLQTNGNASHILHLNNCLQGGEDRFLRMDGKQVFRVAVESLSDIVPKTLGQCGLMVADVDLFVFHQANLRILEAVAKRLAVPAEKLFINLQHYGNTSAASIPITLFEAEQAGRLAPGQVVVLAAIGGGMIWGSNVIRW